MLSLPGLVQISRYLKHGERDLTAFGVENVGTGKVLDPEVSRFERWASKFVGMVKFDLRRLPQRQVSVDFVDGRAAAVWEQFIFRGVLGRVAKDENRRLAW